MVEDEHQIVSPASTRPASFGRGGLCLRKLGGSGRSARPAKCRPRALADAAEEGAHFIEARLVGDRGVDDLASEPAPAGPISGRAEIRLVK